MEDHLHHSFKSTWATTEVVLRCSLKTYSKRVILHLMQRLQRWAFAWHLVKWPVLVWGGGAGVGWEGRSAFNILLLCWSLKPQSGL